jgi:hypothetical protein
VIRAGLQSGRHTDASINMDSRYTQSGGRIMGTKTSGLKLKRGGLLKLVDRETDRCTEGLFIGADENGNFVVVPLSEKRFHPSAGSVLHGQCRVKDDMVAFTCEVLEVLDRPVTMWRIHEPAEVKKYDLRAKTRIHCSISATIEALNQGQVLTGIVRDISKSGARCIFQLSDAAGNPLERDEPVTLSCVFPGIPGEQTAQGQVTDILRDEGEWSIGIRFSESAWWVPPYH